MENTKRVMRLGEGAVVPSGEVLERETGFEPATSTLARSHSTAELLPLSSLSLQHLRTARHMRWCSLHPHLHPLFSPVHAVELGAEHRVAHRQKTLDELRLSVPCLMAVVDVMHGHLHIGRRL
jgi:hypothetical protein